MKGRVHSIESFGAVDGPGIRTVFFMQGCPARCLYCHNPDTWSLTGEGEGELSAEEIVRWALRGKPYHGKDGGVTFSGGEPMLQGEFISHCIDLLHIEGIKTAIDISGTYLDRYSEEVIKKSDLILLDVKHPRADKFKEITKRDFSFLIKTVELIKKHNKPVWIRHVVVPGISDNEEDICALREFIVKIPNVENIELLPYHTMAINKYKKIGIEYPLKGVEAMNPDRVKELRQLL